MPDTDVATGTAGQAARFGSEVLTELQTAVRMAETPVTPAPVAVPETPYLEPEPPTLPASEPIPPPTAESPKLTQEQAARIQDIVERAKADIARIVAEYEAKRNGFSGDLQAQQEEERKRKAQELVAKIQAGGTATL